MCCAIPRAQQTSRSARPQPADLRTAGARPQPPTGSLEAAPSSARPRGESGPERRDQAIDPFGAPARSRSSTNGTVAGGHVAAKSRSIARVAHFAAGWAEDALRGRRAPCASRVPSEPSEIAAGESATGQKAVQRARLEHFQAKWTPVRRPEMRPIKHLERFPDSHQTGSALAPPLMAWEPAGRKAQPKAALGGASACLVGM